MRFDHILDTIGKTPLVKLNRITQLLPCEVYAKCEFFNPGGSIKDRIAYRMVEEAEKSGRIKPGATLIEPTSGNTGIGLALAGAVKGYRVIITMPEKMSAEKQVVLEALGAEIVRTPTEAAFDHPDSHISVAQRLERDLPNAFILDQYKNPNNPHAHYAGTAEEIIQDLDGTVDMVVVGAGTGGTITGVAKRMKEHNPNCIIVAADPVGSILAGGNDVGTYKVEGIGYDFIPEVLDQNIVDEWVKTQDRQSFILARRLIQEEGLLCGGSSGAVLAAFQKKAHLLKPGQKAVLILADGVRNYLTKFVDDHWMRRNQFHAAEELKGSIKEIRGIENKPSMFVMDLDKSLNEAISIMKTRGFSQIPIVNEKNVLVGLLREEDMLNYLLAQAGVDEGARIADVMERNVSVVDEDTSVFMLQNLLDTHGYVVVVNSEQQPVDILTKIDLVTWLAQQRFNFG